MADFMTPPMNPHHKPQEDVAVTQEDREAAASGYYCWISTNPVMPEKMKDGFADDHSMVQAFARHRLLGHEAGRRDMREAAGKPLDYIDLFRIIRRAGRKDAAKAKAVHDAYTAARTAVPTEPLGGEG